MIKSMTGYGYGEITDSGKRITAEIRSVNHRYLDISVKTQRNYIFLEELARKIVSEVTVRGKVDVYISVECIDSELDISLNTAVARSYFEALTALRDDLGIEGKIDIATLSRFNDIFKVDKAEVDQAEIISIAEKVLREAAEGFAAMRAKEGENLAADLESQLSQLQSIVDRLEGRAPQIVTEYKARLTERIKDLLGEVPIDEGRILNEAAVFADRVNTNEEIVRLKSHIEQTRGLIKSGEPIGRKLDFIIQELNREINTIGSKANDLESTKLVMEAKATIEKMREQAQNIE